MPNAFDSSGRHGDGRSKLWAFGGRYYDPIRTNMTAFAGTLGGSIRNESYAWENGFEVGAVYFWNSGTLYSETFEILSRHLPITGETCGQQSLRCIGIGGSRKSAISNEAARTKPG